MYYLVNVDQTALQHISPEIIVKGLRQCCISNTMDVTDENSCGMTVKMMGNVRSQFTEDEGTGCEDGNNDNDW